MKTNTQNGKRDELILEEQNFKIKDLNSESGQNLEQLTNWRHRLIDVMDEMFGR